MKTRPMWPAADDADRKAEKLCEEMRWNRFVKYEARVS